MTGQERRGVPALPSSALTWPAVAVAPFLHPLPSWTSGTSLCALCPLWRVPASVTGRTNLSAVKRVLLGEYPLPVRERAVQTAQLRKLGLSEWILLRSLTVEIYAEAGTGRRQEVAVLPVRLVGDDIR